MISACKRRDDRQVGMVLVVVLVMFGLSRDTTKSGDTRKAITNNKVIDR